MCIGSPEVETGNILMFLLTLLLDGCEHVIDEHFFVIFGDKLLLVCVA